jgi:hypothetical protein
MGKVLLSSMKRYIILLKAGYTALSIDIDKNIREKLLLRTILLFSVHKREYFDICSQFLPNLVM